MTLTKKIHSAILGYAISERHLVTKYFCAACQGYVHVVLLFSVSFSNNIQIEYSNQFIDVQNLRRTSLRFDLKERGNLQLSI